MTGRGDSDDQGLFLSIRGLDVRYGPIHALQQVNLDVPVGRVTSLIGLNGAGKTTLLKALMGLVRPSAGAIRMADGRDVIKCAPHLRASQLGFSYVPEGRGLFSRMSVRENLLVGESVSKRRQSVGPGQTDLSEILDLFPAVARRLDGAAGNLSGGEQQMVAVARALLAGGDILLLDEPSIGLAPVIQGEIFASLLTYVAERGLTLLLVEQKTDFALQVSDYAHVLENGRIRLSGTRDEIINDPSVVSIYFGSSR